MALDNFKIAVIVIMIVTGSFNTLNNKYQNQQYVHQGQHINKKYYHPYIQTFIMFFGQFLALPLYYILKHFNKEQYNERQQKSLRHGKTTDYNIFLISVRSILDTLLTIFQLIALNFLSGSIHQMMKSGTVISTSIFSMLILGMKIKKFQIISIVLTILGIIIIGLVNLLFKQQQTSQQYDLKVLGYLLMIIVIVLNGLQLVYQQWLFSKYHIEPIFMIGMEGFFGLFCAGIVIAIVSNIYCHFGIKACVFDDQSYPYIDRVDVFLRQIWQHKQLLIAIILYINTVYICNTAALFVTKTINALARAICQVSRVILTWIVGMIVTLTIGETQQNYRWQQTQIIVILMKIFGLSIIVIGNLMYNKVIRFQTFEQQYIDDEREHKKIRNQED